MQVSLPSKAAHPSALASAAVAASRHNWSKTSRRWTDDLSALGRTTSSPFRLHRPVAISKLAFKSEHHKYATTAFLRFCSRVSRSFLVPFSLR